MKQNKPVPTEKEIIEGYAFLRRWKRAKGFDDDDIQEIIIRFTTQYTPNYNNEIQLYTLIKQQTYKKYFNVTQKHSSTTMSYDAIDYSDALRTLSVDPSYELEEKESEMALKQQLQGLLNQLTKKQRYAIEEVYLKERSQVDVSIELGLSHQAINNLITTGLAKLNKTILN